MAELAIDEAVRLCLGRLRDWGVSEAAAACVAEHLVESELTGHSSHGLRQLLRYRDLIKTGECDVSAVPVVVSREGPVAKIDANRGFGQPAMRLAVETAVELAAEFKIGVAGVVRAGHTGRMGAWAEQASAAGMFSMIMLAASDPPFALAAAPGADPVLRTNPISLGAPAEDEPLTLDLAMSLVSESSIVLAAARGERVPEGAFADRLDNLSTDPRDYLEGGTLLPAGGYKGFGLAVLVEAFCIALTGADTDGARPTSGAIVICFRSDTFTTDSHARGSVAALQRRVRSSGRTVEVSSPGDRSQAIRSRTHAISVDREVLEVLRGVTPVS